MKRTIEQIQKAITTDLYVEGYHSWDVYENENYSVIKAEMEKKYDCKLSDLDFDKAVDRLELMEDE